MRKPERHLASQAAKHTCGSNVRKAKPLQEQTFCAKDIKIAPIFFRTAQHRKSKQSGDGKLVPPVERLQKPVLPPQSRGVQQVESQQRFSAVSHLPERKKGSRRGQVPPSALHSCLEDIQTSNPAFPVRTVFSTLQKKASERLQDVGSTGEIEQQAVIVCIHAFH